MLENDLLKNSFCNLQEANKKIDLLWEANFSHGMLVPPKAKSEVEAINTIKALKVLLHQKSSFLSATSPILIERANKWREGAEKLKIITGESEAGAVTNQLGMLDIQLILNESQNIQTHEELLLMNSFLITFSYLWVLGAYELIRKMDSILQDKNNIQEAIRKNIKSLKQKFARLRVPLAKLESAEKYKSDFSIALPGVHDDLGVCWQLNKNKIEGQAYQNSSVGIISRRELADQFLDFFKIDY